MSTFAGVVAVWVAIIQAGFLFGLADGGVLAKGFFIVGIVVAIAAMRPNSTKAWMEGLNR